MGDSKRSSVSTVKICFPTPCVSNFVEEAKQIAEKKAEQWAQEEVRRRDEDLQREKREKENKIDFDPQNYVPRKTVVSYESLLNLNDGGGAAVKTKEIKRRQEKEADEDSEGSKFGNVKSSKKKAKAHLFQQFAAEYSDPYQKFAGKGGMLYKYDGDLRRKQVELQRNRRFFHLIDLDDCPMEDITNLRVHHNLFCRVGSADTSKRRSRAAAHLRGLQNALESPLDFGASSSKHPTKNKFGSLAPQTHTHAPTQSAQNFFDFRRSSSLDADAELQRSGLSPRSHKIQVTTSFLEWITERCNNSLRNVFGRLDCYKKGFLTKQDFQGALIREKYFGNGNTLWKLIDKDQKGQIVADDLQNMAPHLSSVLDEVTLRKKELERGKIRSSLASQQSAKKRGRPVTVGADVGGMGERCMSAPSSLSTLGMNLASKSWTSFPKSGIKVTGSKPRELWLFRNADAKHTGQSLLLKHPPRDMAHLYELCSKACRPYGGQTVSLRDGELERITNVFDLQDGGKYVVSGGEPLEPPLAFWQFGCPVGKKIKKVPLRKQPRVKCPRKASHVPQTSVDAIEDAPSMSLSLPVLH